MEFTEEITIKNYIMGNKQKMGVDAFRNHCDEYLKLREQYHEF